MRPAPLLLVASSALGACDREAAPPSPPARTASAATAPAPPSRAAAPPALDAALDRAVRSGLDALAAGSAPPASSAPRPPGCLPLPEGARAKSAGGAWRRDLDEHVTVERRDGAAFVGLGRKPAIPTLCLVPAGDGWQLVGFVPGE